ncbi:MAG: MlaD family protein [Spirochaetia bacterium]|nr:MlaD family protein [Spirochaetia bacterium]
MNRIRIEILTGIVFLAAIAILAYYTILVGKNFIKPEDTYPLTVYFKDAAGLQKENKVMVNGVYSGSVADISLKNNLVEVKLAMFNRFDLYSNYGIFIMNEAAIGGKQIRIYPGEETKAAGGVNESVSLETSLTGSSRDPFDSISSVIEDNRDDIRAAVANLRSFSEKLNSDKGTVAKLLTDDKLANQAGELLEQIKETIEDAREQAPVTSFIKAALTAF